jgi:hypothetical protein
MALRGLIAASGTVGSCQQGTELMTDLLDQALRAARQLPAEAQNEIARLVLLMAGDDQPPLAFSAEEEASFAESRAQASRREFASDEQVRAVWAKHGL